MRQITVTDVDDLVHGAVVLGSGGGGDPYLPQQMLYAALDRHGPVRLVDPEELDPAGLVLPVLSAGAPYALAEQFHGARESGRLRAVTEAQTGRRAVAVLPVQLGAVNVAVPLVVAAQLGLPCLDADAMRRCFPMIEMTLLSLAGLSPSPIVAVDTKGSVVVLSATRHATVSSLLRSVLPDLGLVALISAYPTTTPRRCAGVVARGALSECLRLGRALRAEEPGPGSTYADFLRACQGRLVFTGVVVELVQRVTDGFPKGTLSIESVTAGARMLRVDFQNENLVAAEDGEVLVTVPDLIVLIDARSGTVMQTVDVAVGQHLHVLALPVDPRWHTEAGRALVGPRAFGYDVDPVRVGAGGAR